MTLKEKITKISLDMPLVTSPNKKEISDYEIGIFKLEQIADDYAIEFSKFIETHCVKTEYLHQYFFQEKEHHIKSLLEIFKKEKGL
jgi:hypothetical protein